MSAGPPPVLPAASSPSTRRRSRELHAADARSRQRPRRHPAARACRARAAGRDRRRSDRDRHAARRAPSAIDPALAPGGHPHPTLHGTLREARGISPTNAGC